jgi:UvrD-like helicase C-terminal domain
MWIITISYVDGGVQTEDVNHLAEAPRPLSLIRGRARRASISSDDRPRQNDVWERRHLDWGYAVTSHSSQGQTAGRVLVHVETAHASEKLVNQRLAYVAVSRGQHDARIYTDDKVGLARALVGTSRIDQRLRERPYNHRGKALSAKSHGVKLKTKCEYCVSCMVRSGGLDEDHTEAAKGCLPATPRVSLISFDVLM